VVVRVLEVVTMRYEYESNDEQIDEFRALAELLMEDARDRNPPQLKVYSDEYDVVVSQGDSTS